MTFIEHFAMWFAFWFAFALFCVAMVVFIWVMIAARDDPFPPSDEEIDAAFELWWNTMKREDLEFTKDDLFLRLGPGSGKFIAQVSFKQGAKRVRK